MRCAVIDVGSNSVLLTVADENGNPILELDRVTALGEGLNTSKRLRYDAMERTARAVCDFRKTAEEMGAERVIAVGTMALRVASNSGDFLKLINNLCGIEIKIISGDEEAKLSYEAAVSSLKLSGSTVVADIGGRSTDIACGEDGNLVRTYSLDLGALKILEGSHLNFKEALHLSDIQRLQNEIFEYLSENLLKTTPQNFVIIGGTATNLAAMKLQLRQYDPAKVHGLELSRASIEELLKKLISMPISARRKLIGLQPERAEVIIPGTVIILALMDFYGQDYAIVSDRGLRHAILARCYSDKLKR